VVKNNVLMTFSYASIAKTMK